jgi:5-methylcytosine-specific restriction endonuclease McrA
MRKRKSYRELLDDPRWKKKRDRIVKRAQGRCQICASSKKPFEVHHSYYSTGKKPWEYPDGSLIAICGNCHAGIHALKEFKAAGRNLRDRWQHAPEEYQSTEDPELSVPIPAASVKERFGSIFAALDKVMP